jgi:integrase
VAYIEDRREMRSGKGWRVRYRGPDGKEHSRSFAKRADASNFMHSTEVSKLEGRWADPRLGKTPLRDFSKQWLGARLSIRGATRARDEGMIRNHVLPAFGGVPVARISKLDVQQWITRLSDKGLAPATVRRAYTLLGAMMAEAVDLRMVAESPCRRISLPRSEKVEQRFLLPVEVEHLAEAHPPRYRPLIYSAVYLGARWEELAALRREHLDLLRRKVAIVGTIERVAGGAYRYTGETKSAASRRTLRLPRFLVPMLAQHLERSVTVTEPSEWVFPAPEGGFLRYDNFRRRVWTPSVRRAGLEPLTFHELRHTAAALMIDTGANHLQVQRRLGHSDIRTTLGQYGHLWPNREDDLNDAIEQAFTEARSHAAQARPSGDAEVVSIGGESA